MENPISEVKLLLITGPLGAGKTTIIREILKDDRFLPVKPHVTRKLRPNETEKISIREEEFKTKENKGDFLIVNKISGVYYGTPKKELIKMLDGKKYPVLDWNHQNLNRIINKLKNKLFIVSLFPPSEKILKIWLAGTTAERQRMAIKEYRDMLSGIYKDKSNLEIINEEGKITETAEKIKLNFINYDKI